MKRFIVFFMMGLLSLSAVAQKKDSSKCSCSCCGASACCSSTTLVPYIGIGISTSNAAGSNFKTATYPWLENGVIYKNLGFAVDLGRKQLAGFFGSSDYMTDYYYEAKAFTFFPIGSVTGTVFFGWGGLYNTANSSFIEYGVGLSYGIGKWSIGLNYSNWAGGNYISPGISFTY